METGPGKSLLILGIVLEDGGSEIQCGSESERVCMLIQVRSTQNLAFAKDEAKFSMKKVQHKLTGGLGGREPTVETETGQ